MNGGGEIAPVLFLMPSLTFGGMERLASHMLAHLAGLGCAVHIVAIGTKTDWEDAAGEWFNAAASLTRLPTTETLLIDGLSRLIEKTRPSAAVIIGLSAVYRVLGEMSAQNPDLRLVSFQFNEHELSAEHGVNSPLLDLIIAEGQIVARTLVNLGVTEDRIAIIPSGPDITRLLAANPACDVADTIARHSRGRPVVGFVGRMDQIKQPGLFLDLCQRLRHREASFVMVGDGPLAKTLRADIAARGLSDRIAWLGRAPNGAMGSVYRQIDVVVVPSSLDGRPLVVQEAQICRAAIVASRVGSIPDLVQDGETGLLCEPGDIEGFAAAVERLLDDDALHHHLVEGGHARAMREGGLDGVLAAYSEAILG